MFIGSILKINYKKEKPTCFKGEEILMEKKLKKILGVFTKNTITKSTGKNYIEILIPSHIIAARNNNLWEKLSLKHIFSG